MDITNRNENQGEEKVVGNVDMIIMLWTFCFFIGGLYGFNIIHIPQEIASIVYIILFGLSIYLLFYFKQYGIHPPQKNTLKNIEIENAEEVLLEWKTSPEIKNILISYKSYIILGIVVVVGTTVLIQGITALAGISTYITAVISAICFVFAIGGGIDKPRIKITSEGIMIRNNFKKWSYFNTYVAHENLKVIKLLTSNHWLSKSFTPHIIFANDSDNFYNAKNIISNYLKQN